MKASLRDFYAKRDDDSLGAAALTIQSDALSDKPSNGVSGTQTPQFISNNKHKTIRGLHNVGEMIMNSGSNSNTANSVKSSSQTNRNKSSSSNMN